MRSMLLAAGVVLLLLQPAWVQEDSKKETNPAKAIIAEFSAAQKDFFAVLRAAKTPEERAEAMKKQPNASAYATRMMALAKKDPKSEVAGEALLWVVNMASRAPEGKAAIGMLIEHHAANAALTPQVLDRLSFNPHPQMDKFLGRVAVENPNSAVKEAAAAIQKLVVGKVIPDIVAEDTDGKEFKLSDYRGKVVLLDFWGHW